MRGEPPTEPQRYLFEVTLILAEQSKVVRVREPDATHARATLAAHYPGWQPVEIQRWGGEGWVVATPPA
jgi:hypothetical protein